MTDSAQFDQETWLKDAVLNVFLDTRDCPPTLVRRIWNFFFFFVTFLISIG